MFDHQHPVAKVLRSGGRTLYNMPAGEATDGADGIEYSIWGPTCDGIDRITESIRFPQLLDVGDWLYFEDMGAYTKCSATTFNGFTNSRHHLRVQRAGRQGSAGPALSGVCLKVLGGWRFGRVWRISITPDFLKIGV
jgi:hypothetical protein